MQTDRYTKIVLTVIAACLLGFSLRSTARPVSAAAPMPQEVVIVGWNDSAGQFHPLAGYGEAGKSFQVAPLPVQSK